MHGSSNCDATLPNKRMENKLLKSSVYGTTEIENREDSIWLRGEKMSTSDMNY